MTSQVTRPWSGLEIEIKLAQVIEDQNDAVALQKALQEAWANAQYAYKLTHAQMMLRSGQDSNLKTADMRAAWVMTQVADLMLKRDIALGQYEAQKAVAYTLQSEADSLRSLLKSSRDVTDGPGWGGGPQR